MTKRKKKEPELTERERERLWAMQRRENMLNLLNNPPLRYPKKKRRNDKYKGQDIIIMHLQ